VRGRKVATLVDGEWASPGLHRLSIPAGFAPGVYFVRLTLGTETESKKVLITR
jgi:hypothetical protein